MKKYIYKYSFGGLILLLSLSSCCLNPYGSKQSSKNSNAINHESATLTKNEKKPSRRSRRLFTRRNQVKKETQKVQTNFKKYEDQVTDQDKKDISFVVSAAAEKSSISLAMSQSEIKGALNRIRELHPLALLKLVSENPSLIEGMKKMQGRDWIWNMFLNELSEVFSQAVSQGIITEEDIAAFASTLNLDSGAVSSIVQGERWPELLDIVISQPS